MTDTSVIVPSYRRPEYLARCLDALANQRVPPAETIVVARRDDTATRAAAAPWPATRVVEVESPGVLAALRQGCEAASADVIAFTDDDAAPRPDWIASLGAHFNHDVGGVGGRDVIATEPGGDAALTVGLVNAWGRLVGNHHLGAGAPREVDVLKGVNMAFRREALELPTRLRGAGAQVHWEVAVSLAARMRGWRLVYDPAILVDHFVAPRLDADRRVRPATSAIEDAAYNLQLTFLSIPYVRRWRRVAYSMLVGDRAAPGLARTLAAAVRMEGAVLRSAGPAGRGNLKAVADYSRGARVTNSAVPPAA